ALAAQTRRSGEVHRGNQSGINSGAQEPADKTGWTERAAQDHCAPPARLPKRTGTPLQGGGRWFETTSAHSISAGQRPIRAPGLCGDTGGEVPRPGAGGEGGRRVPPASIGDTRAGRRVVREDTGSDSRRSMRSVSRSEWRGEAGGVPDLPHQPVAGRRGGSE